MVEDGRLVRSVETACLVPGVGEMIESFPAKEPYRTHRGYLPTLTGTREPEGLEIPSRQLPHGSMEP